MLFVHLESIISSSFCLTFCVSFNVLGTSVISPSFERMILCRKCYVGPSGAVPLITGARCSEGIPYMSLVYPYLVAGLVCCRCTHGHGLLSGQLAEKTGCDSSRHANV